MTESLSRQRYVPLILAAAAILLITMGVRQTSGLFLLPITASTGVSVVAISFALAVGQFVFGAAQPIFGAIADKYGAVRVILAGALMMALGSLLTPFMTSSLGLLLTMGVLGAAGAAAGSFSILIGLTAQHLPPERRSMASGFINAGGSIGQFVFAPVVQLIIGAAGWASAMFATAFAALLTIPLVLPLMRATSGAVAAASSVAAAAHLTLREQLRVAMRDRSYLCCMRDSSPVAFTLRFWSRICPAISSYAGSLRQWPRTLWRSLGCSTWSVASGSAGSVSDTA